MRINRYLAQAGLGSRREVEKLVQAGRVSINGELILDLARQVADTDDVRVDNRLVRPKHLRYFAFHKPPGLICTRSDERNRATIYSVLARNLQELDYVGRLDKDSEGLLILTNDGDLAQRLTNPRFKVEKEYEVVLDRPFDTKDLQRLLKGTVIDGTRARVRRAWIRHHSGLGIVLDQGIKRQIRVMLQRLGYDVRALKRVRIGSVKLGRLPRAMVRELSSSEITRLMEQGSPARGN